VKPRIALLAIFLAVTAWAWMHPVPAPIFSDREVEKAEAGHQQELPIQAYYHQSFFGEPWRQPERSQVLMLHQGLGALDVLLVLEGALSLRRRRRIG
jgi:hypothetical protein